MRNDRENNLDNYLQRYSEVIDKYSYELIFDSQVRFKVHILYR